VLAALTLLTMELTKAFNQKQYAEVLEAWQWLGVEGRTPLGTTLFGDIFLRGADGCSFLDVIQGTHEVLWADEDALQADLQTDDGRDRILLAPLVEAAEQRGMRLRPAEVYDFTVAPVIGGRVELGNIQPTDFVVAVDMAGQIHEQLRDVPVGTPIKGFGGGASRGRPERAAAPVSTAPPPPAKRGRFRRG
jgi:hypothetical protein